MKAQHSPLQSFYASQPPTVEGKTILGRANQSSGRKTGACQDCAVATQSVAASRGWVWTMARPSHMGYLGDLNCLLSFDMQSLAYRTLCRLRSKFLPPRA